MGTTQGRLWPSVGSTLGGAQRGPGGRDEAGSRADGLRMPMARWSGPLPTLVALLGAALLGYVCFRSGQRSQHRESQQEDSWLL